MDRNEAHILVLPILIQSHINPLLQFSKRLASKGLIVTLVIPSSTKRFSINASTSCKIRVEHIYDGSSEGEKLGSNERIERLRSATSQSLAQLIKRLLQSDCPPKLLVYDSAMPWALDVALEHGLHGAIFFTNSCAVNAVYCLLHQGLQIPLQGPVDSIPSAPVLEQDDLPTMVTRDFDKHPVLMKMVVDQLSDIQKAKCHLFNSFMELEEPAVKWMRSQIQCPILTVGPTIPSAYLDKRIEDDRDYGLCLFKPDMEACMKWLDSMEPDSVVYVSFGSLASLGEEQMEELAWGLKNSNKNFLWVVRESDKTKLPANFVDETAEKGLVVSWCSQLEVLNHRAVGCFMTHCGWNSTVEALSLGVPMVVMPQWTDQPTNAKYIVDVWRVGIRVRQDEKRIGRREEIEACVKEMIEGQKGKEIKNNSLRWRELAQQAMAKGGSSDNDMEEFISKVVST